MYDFIKIQYKLKNITAEQIMKIVPKWISEEQAREIIEGDDK